MKKINSNINNYTDNIYYICRTILIIGLPLTIISGLVLSHSSFHSFATGSNSGTDNLAITISTSCTLGSTVNTPHSKEVYNGNYETNIGKTTITTLCNDGNGYSIYANGYSNNEEGNNKLINSTYPQYSIDTGLATSGLTSTWAMKLNNIPNDPSPTPPTIDSSYNDTYGLVPTQWTKVAGRTAGTTDMDKGSSFTTTYAVYASSNQHAGSYVGQVQYALIHPSTKPYYYFMQDVATWKDTELPNVGDSIQAVDSRDGKKYWVTRLADGNVWMTQNLDFDIAADEQDPTKIKTLTSEDTDLTDHSLTGAYSQANGYSYDESTGIISWTPDNTAKTINFEGTTVTGWQSSNTEPYSASKTDDTETGHTSLGNWYNWTAAIASNNSSSLTQDTLNNISNNPKNSICPKGWRLPTISSQSEVLSNSTNEFARLNYLYNSNSTTSAIGLLRQPVAFSYSGLINGSPYGFDTLAYYWSSTINSNYVYYFRLSTQGSPIVDTARAGGLKSNGFSVRCVVK